MSSLSLSGDIQNMLKPAITSLLLFVSVCTHFSWSQAVDSTIADAEYLIGLSLDDLLKVKIISASREEEDIFDAPNSSFVITKEEIELMGATSIPEALKLCPGLIVREVTNGNYDVSIRGGIDGFPAYNFTYTNSTILVMVDNRPVFSSFQGGTYWQNLPVGLADIERIEIVNGPSSPLYGPNAVSGVVNIITHSHNQVGKYFHGSMQNNYNNDISSIQLGEKFNDKFAINFSVNHQTRTRQELDFYNPKNSTYESLDSALSFLSEEEVNARFPNPSQSLFKLSSSVSAHYTPNQKINISATVAKNSSTSLTPLTAQLPLSNYTNSSISTFLQAKFYNFSFTTSLLDGEQGLTGALSHNKYNYKNTDFYLDYNLELFNKRLSVKPAITHQSAAVDDREFTTNVGKNGTFDGHGKITNNAVSIKIDGKLINNIRVIGAIRYDIFNHPDEGILSWQGIVNYKLKKKHLFRFVSGSSNSGAFLVPILINNINAISPTTNLVISGNKNLDLLNNISFEVGYRTKVIANSTLDIALFTQEFSNFHSPILQTPKFDPIERKLSLIYNTENLDLKVLQQGITISLQTNLADSKIQLRPHFTLQSTKAEEYTPFYNVKGAFDSPGFTLEGHIDTTYVLTEKFTPSFWGGINVIIKPIDKLYIDLSSYFYDDYILHMGSEASLETGEINNQPGSLIASKLRLNINTTYSFTDSFSVFLNARNITNQKANEGFGTDKLSTMILGGIRLLY